MTPEQTVELDSPFAPAPFALPKRRQRSLSSLDAEEIVASVLERLSQDLDDRAEWMEDHLRRYAKYRGWVEAKTWQFEDAPNSHIPISMYTCQRAEDGLYNAVISQRPVMQSKATQAVNITKQSRVDNLLDVQIFDYADGMNVLADTIHNFFVDGTVHVLPRWVRGRQSVRLFERLPAPPQGTDIMTYLLSQFHRLYGAESQIVSVTDHRFTLQSVDGPIELEVYEGTDGDLEVIEQRDLRLDHLAISVEDVEDVVVPSNCINPQPPSASNPRGAHHVFRLCSASLDTITARQKDGTYDLLTTDDLEAIADWTDRQVTDDTSRPKEQKDDLEGVQSQLPLASHATVQIVEAYDRWDVDGDGLEEDVIFWVITDGGRTQGRLARARYLTEIIPPGPHGARRPIEKFCLFPVPNRYYGMSLLEMIEGIQDLINMFFNMGAHFGIIQNAPFFFYRAASGLKPEIIKLNPGEGYPLDDPRGDVHFPQLPNSQGTFIFQELALLNQFLERLTMFGQLQYGGIPQGKSAAFRTAQTTMSVLQQGDMRPERVLRRFFEGLARVWDQSLALCQRYLPPSTEYRIHGVPESQEAFDRIVDRQELAGQFRFEWRATILNTNPMLQQQTAMSLVQTLISPLLIQAGIVGTEQIYRVIRRFLETTQEPNPDQFIMKPPGVSNEPKLTAEQAISLILAGRAPTGVSTMEPIQEHAQKLTAFMQSDQFGVLSQQQVTVFGDYLRRVMEAATLAMQQAQMAQMAQGFQQQLGGGNGQPGAPPTDPGVLGGAMAMSPASPAEAGETPQGGTM